MLVTCESCGNEFLAEADPHVVRPTPQGYKLYCVCQIKGFEEVEPGEDVELSKVYQGNMKSYIRRER